MCYGEFRIFVTVDFVFTLRANLMATCKLQVYAFFLFRRALPRLWNELPKEPNFANLFIIIIIIIIIIINEND